MAEPDDTQSFEKSRTQHAEKMVVAAVAYVQNPQISAREAAARIVALVKDGLKVASSRKTSSRSQGDTPGLESFLWSFWGVLMQLATREQPELQDRIIDVLSELKKHGNTGCEGMRVWGRAMDWKELPIFGADARETMNGPDAYLPGQTKILPRDTPLAYQILSGGKPEDPNDVYSQAYAATRSAWLNTVRYLMKVWASNVYDFEIYGIWFMREGLEDFDLSDPETATDVSQLPPALALEAASVCVQVAGKKMYRSTLIAGPNGDPDWDPARGQPGKGGKRWTGVDGYHPDRWKLWKKVFQEYASAAGKEGIWPNAVEAAKTAIAAMNRIESAGDH